MTSFAVLAHYLSEHQKLTLAPDFAHLAEGNKFTVTNGTNALNLEFIDQRYIHYSHATGTPNEIFTIQEVRPGEVWKVTAKHHDPMIIEELGDYLVKVLADLNLPASRRLAAQ